jgi:hypothetical protein
MEPVSEDDHTDVSDEDDGESSSDEDDSQEVRARADAEHIEKQQRLKEQERLKNLIVSYVIDPAFPHLGTVSAPRWLIEKHNAIRRRY